MTQQVSAGWAGMRTEVWILSTQRKIWEMQNMSIMLAYNSRIFHIGVGDVTFSGLYWQPAYPKDFELKFQ